MSVSAANTVAAATQSISGPATIAGSANGSPERKPNDGAPETAPQFGELLKNIQSKYGAQPEKAREIKKTLGKDDFLRIMITQMRNQDPTNPFKAEQMATEMAQFTTVEQLKNMNESLTKMTTPNQPIERMAMTGMIGKTVTVDRGRFPHQEGVNDIVSFGLPREAASVNLSLVNEHGETVLTKDLGKLKAGENEFHWDGKKLNSLPAKTGTYMIRVEAMDEQGQKMDTNATTSARVIGISFEGQEPVFLIGDNLHQEKVTMKNIVRIDENGGGGFPQAGGGMAQQAAPMGAPKAPPSLFSFQKGVGSIPFDATAASPDVQKALADYQSAGNGAAPAIPGRPAPAQPGADKGFPNGLHDDDGVVPAVRANPSQPSQTQKGG